MCQGITKRNMQCRNRTEPYCYLHVDQIPEVKIPEVKAPEVKAPEVKAPEVKAPKVKSHGEYPTDILNIIMDYHQGTKDDFKLKFNKVIAEIHFDQTLLNEALERLGLLYDSDDEPAVYDCKTESFSLPPFAPHFHDNVYYSDSSDDELIEPEDSEEVKGALARLGLL